MSKKLIILIGLVVLILISAVTFFVITKEEDPYIGFAKVFVEDIANGANDVAYAQFSVELQTVHYMEDFEAELAKFAIDGSCELKDVVKTDTTTDEVGATTTVTGKIVCDEKTINNAEFVYNANQEMVSYAFES